MSWAKPTESRDQIVLFPEKLDDAIPVVHWPDEKSCGLVVWVD